MGSDRWCTCDHRYCYNSKAIIFPCKDAKIWHHGNRKVKLHRQDENLRSIRKHGRRCWKRDFGYHRCSIAETTMFHFKTIFGGNLSTRQFGKQAVELFIKCAALSQMIRIAKLDSYKVEA